MAKLRKSGKRLFTFSLFGNDYDVRLVTRGHAELDSDPKAWGMAYMEQRLIYIRTGATLEQKQTTLMHEIEHIIEDHYCIDHEEKCDNNDDSESRTDKISLGWLYLIRSNPHVIDFLRQKSP
jgi:Zn-dependent peptidase ImmA (M78 family)